MSEPKQNPPRHMDVRHVAHLARMDVTEAECLALSPQLDRILEFVDMLSRLDLDGMEPTAHAVDRVNVLREDEPKIFPETDTLVDNMPARIQDRLVRMPKIVEDA